MFTFWQKQDFQLQLSVFEPGKWQFLDDGVLVFSGKITTDFNSFCYLDVLKYLSIKLQEDHDNHFKGYEGDALTWIENGRNEDLLQILAEEKIV